MLWTVGLSYNSNNLSMGSDYMCKYLDSKNRKCAIGRFLSDKLCNILDNMPTPSVMNLIAFEKLPNWMREMGRDFLCNVQRLHDGTLSWDDKGLSKIGLERLKDLENEYCKPDA